TLAPLQPELSYNFVRRVIREDQSLAILKIGIHKVGHLREVNSLIQFKGQGAVRILEVDSNRCAYLMEDISPGLELKTLFDSGHDEDATRICAAVIQNLQANSKMTPNNLYKPIAALAGDFDNYLANTALTGIPPKDVHEAKNIFENLLQTTTAEILLHGDLHHQNILASKERHWLAIDPKGFIGDPCFEIGAFMRNPAPQIADAVSLSSLLEKRVLIFSKELGFSPTRIIDWSYAQAILAGVWASLDHGKGWQPWYQVARALNELRS
ncbi:MAG TPA: aminoglycoside phosphotransferase family protein, partial [Bdellovibrio sp.]|nr:aminoglycoside phosphotransferase family protein [Bdellovibrio sp.]